MSKKRHRDEESHTPAEEKVPMTAPGACTATASSACTFTVIVANDNDWGDTEKIVYTDPQDLVYDLGCFACGGNEFKVFVDDDLKEPMTKEQIQKLSLRTALKVIHTRGQIRVLIVKQSPSEMSVLSIEDPSVNVTRLLQATCTHPGGPHGDDVASVLLCKYGALTDLVDPEILQEQTTACDFVIHCSQARAYGGPYSDMRNALDWYRQKALEPAAAAAVARGAVKSGSDEWEPFRSFWADLDPDKAFEL